MTRVFKHMKLEHARAFKEGHVRIGSLAYYRSQERQVAIRDSQEGQTVGTLDRIVLTTDHAEPVVTTIAGLKFAVASGGVIGLGNTQFVRELPPTYIYSTSRVSLAGHFAGYDATVCINDIERFGRLLVDGRRDLFLGYHSGWVGYEERSYDALGHEGIDPSPFVKGSSFARDEEFRLVLLPALPVQPFVDVHLESITESFLDGLCEVLQPM